MIKNGFDMTVASACLEGSMKGGEACGFTSQSQSHYKIFTAKHFIMLRLAE